MIVLAVAMHLAQRWVLLKHIMSKTEPLMAQLASMFIAAIYDSLKQLLNLDPVNITVDWSNFDG